MTNYTAIVIGSGPAGHTCAVRMAQLGAKVAVVERDYVGGICTNWGCTPSKSMIESAKVARTVRESRKYGIQVPGWSVSFEHVAARRDEIIRTSRHEVVQLLEHFGVDVYQGEAELVTPGRVRVRQGQLDLDGEVMHYNGQEQELTAQHVVLATGSQPLIPGFIPRHDPSIVSSNRLISIDRLPETLTIVGGGVIGLEFATIFSNLGSRVTIVELLDHVLATMDPEISEEITRHLSADGVRILTGHQVLGVKHGLVQARNRSTGEDVEITAEMILVAIGRQAVVHPESYDQLGIQHSPKGIVVDDFMQTSVPSIWAIGDATGKSILAHVGMQQGLVCAENIMRPPAAPPRRMDYEVIPAVVYTIPEVVGVGTVPVDMSGVSVFKVPFTKNLRARIEDYDAGFIKIWVKANRVVAAQAIGHNVSEIMQELANMVALKTELGVVADIIHAHPTYSEITRSVLQYALGKAADFYLEE